MGKGKRIVTFLVAMVMCFSVTSNVFASQSTDEAEWRGFPVQKRESYSSAYTMAVQRFLYDYNSTTREIIENSNGCNGKFGPGTESALIKYQSSRGLSSDGHCGPATWGDLYSTLDYSGRQYVYFPEDGGYDAYKKKIGYANYMVRLNTAHRYWYIRTSHPSGTTDPESGSYRLFGV